MQTPKPETQIKLGFYIPNSGQIIINNKYSLQDLELNSYHQQMSAIFQDFSLYARYSIDVIFSCKTTPQESSAIDPIIEKEFLDFIFKKSQSKIALIITHRMGSVRQANEIIVLDKGKLIEQGNFKTLMDKQGLFSELYLKQQY